MTKLKKINCEKTKKKKKKFTLVIVTVVTVAVVAVVIVTSFSKNNLTPQQLMRYSRCSFLRFLQCLSINHVEYFI